MNPGSHFALDDYPKKGWEAWDPCIDIERPAAKVASLPDCLPIKASTTSLFGTKTSEIIGCAIPLAKSLLLARQFLENPEARLVDHSIEQRITASGGVLPNQPVCMGSSAIAPASYWEESRLAKLPGDGELYVFLNSTFQKKILLKQYLRYTEPSSSIQILRKSFSSKWNGAAVLNHKDELVGVLVKSDEQWFIHGLPQLVSNP